MNKPETMLSELNNCMPKPYRGNVVKDTEALKAWHASTGRESALEPELPIIDPHHHLYDAPSQGQRYLLPDLLDDMQHGHNIVATVYVEAYRSMWRKAGPPAMQPVGEIEFAAGVSAMAASGTYGHCKVAAAIVGYADLTLGAAVEDVLNAQLECSGGRLRGIRQQVAYEPGHIGSVIRDGAPQHLLLDGRFREGIARLAQRDLSFDVWAYHTQLDELHDLIVQSPNTRFVLNHIGGVIGVADYSDKRGEIFAYWRERMKALAPYDNLVIKVGGLGMAVFGFGFEHRSSPARSEELAAAWAPYIDTCIELFGTERCMFESNFPVDKQSCGYTELWNAFKRASRSLSPAERQSLFYGTAHRTYRMDGLLQ